MRFVPSCFLKIDIIFLLFALNLWVSQADLMYYKEKEKLSVADFNKFLLLIQKNLKFISQKKKTCDAQNTCPAWIPVAKDGGSV